jgi:hypothetical protein
MRSHIAAVVSLCNSIGDTYRVLRTEPATLHMLVSHLEVRESSYHSNLVKRLNSSAGLVAIECTKNIVRCWYFFSNERRGLMLAHLSGLFRSDNPVHNDYPPSCRDKTVHSGNQWQEHVEEAKSNCSGDCRTAAALHVATGRVRTALRLVVVRVRTFACHRCRATLLSDDSFIPA